MLLILISLAAIIFFISLSWKVQPKRCWTYLNGSKDDILFSLKSCIENCWSRHEFGKEPTTDDCYIITLFSTDKEIEKNDIESLDKPIAKSYLDTLLANTPYRIKVRYNYTGSEISIVNYGYCGNNIIEEVEECEGDDLSLCEVLEGPEVCFVYKGCINCNCVKEKKCDNNPCLQGRPTRENRNLNTEWCMYCKEERETNCHDNIDNDCNGLIDEEETLCRTPTPTPTPTPPLTPPPPPPPPPPTVYGHGCATGWGGRKVCIQDGKFYIWYGIDCGPLCCKDEKKCDKHWKVESSTPGECVEKCGGWNHGEKGPMCCPQYDCCSITSICILFEACDCAPQETLCVQI